MNDEKLHSIVSNYFLSDIKANRSIKEADDMASRLLASRDQQIALDAVNKELEYLTTLAVADENNVVNVEFTNAMHRRIRDRLATLKAKQEKEKQ